MWGDIFKEVSDEKKKIMLRSIIDVIIVMCDGIDIKFRFDIV